MSSKVIIIDDEPLARSIVIEYIQHFPDLIVSQVCSNGFEGIKAIQQYKPDLIILDIQMPKINGFEMLELIENPPAVIFATAFDEYAIKAFEAHAIDYLLKPVKPERLEIAIQRVLELQEIKSKAVQYSMHFENDFLMIKEGTVLNKVHIADILYLEALTNYTKVVTVQKKYITLNNLKSFLDHLPSKKFLRIHRSYAVAVDKIQGVYKNELLIESQRLPLGKTYRQEVKKLFTESN